MHAGIDTGHSSNLARYRYHRTRPDPHPPTTTQTAMKPIPSALSVLLVLSAAACDKTEPSASSSGSVAPATQSSQLPPSPTGMRVVHSKVAPGKGKPIVLTANQSVSGKLDADSSGQLAAFGVRIGNYFKSSDGSLALRLCIEGACQDARMPLAGSKDNNYLVFQLPQPATVAQGQTIDYTLTRSGDATNRVAVWAYPTLDGQPGLTDTAGQQTRLVPRLALHLRE